MSDKSPDLPTPKQAVATAEKILDSAKKNPPVRPVQEERMDKERTDKERMDEEFRFHAPGKDSSVAEEAEAYLEEKRDQAQERKIRKAQNIHEAGLYLINKFNQLKNSVIEKIWKDKNANVIGSTEKEIPRLEQPKKVTIPTEDGKVVFTIDFIEGQGSRLHITQFTSVTSDFGEDSEEITSDIVIAYNELSVSLKDLETGDDDVHRIFADGSKPNEVDKDTPSALQKAAALIELYTGPIGE